ncbi:MAG: MCE family protein [Paludibacteraceae bacterium]|nr:MCE family protein [Paludibacteraceae bacterium]
MKHAREIKVAILGIVCLGLLYFGFYFLKGVNLFSPTYGYTGIFSDLGGLTEQAPVYIKGYKVGQVDKIAYDFSAREPFTVSVSIDKHIALTEGTTMMLVADGLLGGKAIELRLPQELSANTIHKGDTLPTGTEPSLTEMLETGLLAHVDSVILKADSLVALLQTQLEGDHIKRTLANVDKVSSDLTVSSRDIRTLTHDKLPQVVDSVENIVNNAGILMANLKDADIKGTVSKLDTTIGQVSELLASKEGTLGMLLNDKSLYTHADSAIMSVDSLVTDLKAHPKRYVHFSLFGSKDKKNKKRK